MYLSKAQITNIEKRVGQSQVLSNSLDIDLIDHMCCLVEEKMQEGAQYSEALEEVLAVFDRKHISDLDQTTKLLTQNKFTMKKRTIIIGFIAFTLSILGAIFKIMHLQGAALLWILGIIVLVFGFLLSLTADKFVILDKGIAKFASILGFVGASGVILGLGLKMLQWPIANHSISGGAFFLLLYFVLNNMVKNTESKTM